MNTPKLLSIVRLMGIPLVAACEPPIGSVTGEVTVEGTGIDGVLVILSTGATNTTMADGVFRFDGIQAGAYSVTISNYPTDASFPAPSATANVETDGQVVTVNFPGSWIRTSAIIGSVSAESQGLSGVTVTVSGMERTQALTDGNGLYNGSNLRKGTYTIEISGYDPEEYEFDRTAATETVGLGESRVVAFTGTHARTSAVVGQVSVEDQEVEGVTVRLQGIGEARVEVTNSAGRYFFEELRKGAYAVGISGYDTEEVGFESTSKTVAVGYGETASIPFEGTYLRASAVGGQVSVEGWGLPGVTVSLTGKGENLTATTNAAGQYFFEKLRKGAYAVGISGYDTEEVGFESTSKTVAVGYGETASIPFEGTYMRASAVGGQVSAEGKGLDGVTVRLKGRGENLTATTNAAGQYAFDDLRKGYYSIAISGYDDDEYGFDVTSRSVSVAYKETATVEFDGIMLRTAAIEGMVTIKGDGLKDVTVTVAGGPKDEEHSTTTNAEGMFKVYRLHAGDYSVTISGYDTEEYEFEVTSKSVSVGLRETVDVAFDGTQSQ